MPPKNRERLGSFFARDRSRGAYLPSFQDDRGAWVPVAAILLLALAMVSLSIYVTYEVPRLRAKEEFRRAVEIKEGLTHLQQDLARLEPGVIVDLQAALARGVPSIYAPREGGTITVVDAPKSSIRVITHTSRWDFEEGMRSENGLSENICTLDGVITLDNQWWGNRFITNTHRSLGYEITSDAFMWSVRFVAQRTGTIDNAYLYIYRSTAFGDADNWFFWIAEDSNGKPGSMIGNRVTENFDLQDGGDILDENGEVTNPYRQGWYAARGLNAPVTADNIYHLVIQSSGQEDQAPNVYNYIVVGYLEPRNPVWVDNRVTNENRAVLYYAIAEPGLNQQWTEFPNYEPIYVLQYSDGTYEGTPYHTGFKYYSEKYYYGDTGKYGEDRVYILYLRYDDQYSAGKIYSGGWDASDQVWGENFNVSPITVTAFEVPIAKIGEPTYDLEVTIENSTWRETFALKPRDIRGTQTPAWYRFVLSQPRTLSGNYWIYLRTRGYTAYDYYAVPLDNADGLSVNLSWNGTNSRAFRADMPAYTDDFDNLQLFDNVDMSFRLVFQNYRSPGMYTSPVLKAPGGRRVKWLNLTWENITPAGTSVVVEVRVGDVARYPQDPNVFDDPNRPWSEWREVQKGQDLGEVFGVDLSRGIDNRVASALQYRVRLSTTDPTQAPRVWNIHIRYYEGTGTTRPAPPIWWTQTTERDFELWTENENVSATAGGAVVLAIGGAAGVGTWTQLADAPKPGDYGCGVVGTGDAIYLASDAGTSDHFWRYIEGTGWEVRAAEPQQFKSGTVLVWDDSRYIYVLFGGSYSDDPAGPGTPRHYFYRYDTVGNSWSAALADTSTVNSGGQGAGDWAVFVPGSALGIPSDNFIYAGIGSKPAEHGYGIGRYSIVNDTWTTIPMPTFWDGFDDGASAAWDGGDYIYVFQGERSESSVNNSWARFNIQTETWEELPDLPFTPYGGVADGGSLIWLGRFGIRPSSFFAVSGGTYAEDPSWDFWEYDISSGTWTQLQDVTIGDGFTKNVGRRIGYAQGSIYAWSGRESGATYGGDDFARYQLGEYFNNGEFTSVTFDAGEEVSWKRVEYYAGQPENTSISIYIQFSTDGVNWTEYAPNFVEVEPGRWRATLEENRTRYVRYRAVLSTTDNQKTPSLQEVRIYYVIEVEVRSWTQDDWSGIETAPTLEVIGEDEAAGYDNYYSSENVYASVRLIALEAGPENRSWGDNFRVDVALGSDNLNAQAQRLSLRFRAQRTENLVGARIYVDDYGTNTTLAFRIHEDNASNPGTPGVAIGPEAQVQITSTGWHGVTFSPSTQELVAGDVYHILVRVVPTPQTGAWAQTTWLGGPQSPVQVGTWTDAYDNYYQGENIDNTQPGKIRLRSTTTPEPGIANHVVISEVYPDAIDETVPGIGEFVELYNPTSQPFPLTNWTLEDLDGTSITLSGTIPAQGFFLIAGPDFDQSTDFTQNNWPAPDIDADLNLANTNDEVILKDNTGNVVDNFGYGPSGTPPEAYEGSWFVWDPAQEESAERKARSTSTASSMLEPTGADAELGNGYDTDNNAADFVEHAAGDANPENSSSPTETPPSTTTYENGWFTSSVYDAGNVVRWDNISWSENKPTGTTLNVYLRFDNTGPYDGPDNILGKLWQGPVSQGSLAGLENRVARYVQYRVVMETTDPSVTPELWDITLNYTIPTAAGTWVQTTWVGGPGQADWSLDNMFDTSENIDWENNAGNLELQGVITGAVSGTWTQTNWSGGEGQLMWSDPTRYYENNENIDVSDADNIKLRQIGDGAGVAAFNPTDDNVIQGAWVSGAITDLASNNEVYVTYQSAYTGTAGGGPENRAVDAKDPGGDTTGDALADAQTNNAAGASPGGVVAGDGWYTADKGYVMHFDSIDTSNMLGDLTQATLWVQYSVEAGYGGTNPVEWSIDEGTTWTSTGITPSDADPDDTVASYDLYAAGVDTVAELEALDVRFLNNDRGGADAVSFDYIWVEAAWTGADEYTVEVEFLGSSNTEPWDNLVWSVDSAWDIGSVDVTLQLYDYSTGVYPTTGDGYISYTSSATANVDETQNQTITTNPTNFRSAAGEWKVKITGVKATSTQFNLNVDWVEYEGAWTPGAENIAVCSFDAGDTLGYTETDAPAADAGAWGTSTGAARTGTYGWEATNLDGGLTAGEYAELTFDQVSVSGYTNVVVHVWVDSNAGGFESGDNMVGYVNIDGTGWTQFFYIYDDAPDNPTNPIPTDWTEYTYDVGTANTVQIRLGAVNNAAGESFYWDDVFITGVPAAGYTDNGVLISSIYDSGATDVTWDNVEWDAVVPTQTNAEVWVRFDNDNSATGIQDNPWENATSNPYPLGVVARYAQYRVVLYTDNAEVTPALSEIRFNYTGTGAEEYYPSGVLVSSTFDSGDNDTLWDTVEFDNSGYPGVQVEVAVDNTSPPTNFLSYDNGQSIGINARYARYRVTLSTADNTQTPIFEEIRISYAGAAAEEVGWVKLRVSQPLENKVPYDLAPDENQNVLFYDGASWFERDNTPVYVLDWEDDRYGGNPYTDNYTFPIAGVNRAGMQFTPAKTMLARGVYAYVRKVGSGTPADHLRYTLEEVGGSILQQGVLAQNTTFVDENFHWVWTGFEGENYLVKDRGYRLYLSSPGSSTPRYELLMPTTDGSSDPYISMTFDGSSSRGWTSAEGENLQRDALIRLIVADNFRQGGLLESSVFDAGASVAWGVISWQATTSLNTTVEVQTRTGDTENAYDGTWSSWQTATNGGDIPSPDSRYIQYRIIESTTDDDDTPVFHEIRIDYSGVGADIPPLDSLVRTWINTTRLDFLAGREPNALHENIEVVAPGDVTLRATDYWGNEFYGTSSYSPKTKLDTPGKMFSIRFVARPREGVTAENLYRVRILTQVINKGEVRGPGDSLKEANDDNWWRIRICQDNNGIPDLSPAGVLAENVGRPSKSWSWEWFMPYPRMEVRFDPMPVLTPGETYHIVIDANPLAPSYVSEENYIIIVATKPRHPDNLWINNENYNTNRGVLFSPDGGTTWETSEDPLSVVYNREPVYVLDLDTDGDGYKDTYEGNPYYKGTQAMWGHYYHGQRIVMMKEYGDFTGDNVNVGAVEFYAQAIGDPGEVYVRLGTLSEEVLAGPLDIPSGFNWGWVRATLPMPLRLWENETYELYLLSPSSDSSNYVDVQTMKTPWAYQYAYTPGSYGGSTSVYLFSEDGETWSSKAYRDLPFRFVTGYRSSGTFLSEIFDAGQVVDWQYIEWDATKPPGDNINVYIRVGGTPVPDVGWTGWQGPLQNGASLAGLPNQRYAQYRIDLTSREGWSAPAVHEVRVGYLISFGSLRIQMQNQNLGKQTLVYEGGSVIVEQGGRSTMYSYPTDMIVAVPIDASTLRLDVNYSLLRCVTSLKSIALKGMAGVKFFTLENAVITRSENTSSVDVVIVSDFAEAWEEYLLEISNAINRVYGSGASTVSYAPNEREVKLSIEGPLTGSTGDIIFTESVREIYVQIL